VAPATIEKLARELAAAVDTDLDHDGVDPADRTVAFEVDMRFAKQVFELPVTLASSNPDAVVLDALVDAFRSDYSRRYGPGSIVLGSPIELVSLRAIGTGATPRADLEREPRREPGAPALVPAAGSRPVRLERGPGGVHEIAVHESDALSPGRVIFGPALVDAPDTTVWIPPLATGRVDDHGTLVLEVETGPDATPPTTGVEVEA
jgi:N-methylhydantoinase A